MLSAPLLRAVWYRPPRRHPRSHEEFGASDDGVRVTCPASDDAVVVYLTGLTLSNHERQVHIVRGHRAAERPPTPPDLVRMISRLPTSGVE